MKKVILASAIGLAMSAAAFAAPTTNTNSTTATTPWYVSATGGMNVLAGNVDYTNNGTTVAASDTWDNGYTFGMKAGYFINTDQTIAVEGSVNVINSQVASGVDSSASYGTAGDNWYGWAFMANGLYRFTHINNTITPFAGLGIGMFENYDADNSDIATQRSFAYQALVGVSYQINPQISADVDYQLLTTVKSDDATSASSTDTPYYNLINVGVTYRF